MKEFGFEGIVTKRKDTCYEIGKRTGAWVKYKVNKAQEFVIGGYTPDNPLDALIVGYYEGEKLIFVSKVRNGLVPRLRREVWQKLKNLETDVCPFSNLPEKKRTQWALTREEMKNCIWLKATWLESLNLPSGHLTVTFGMQSSAASERIRTLVMLSARSGNTADQNVAGVSRTS